MNGEDKYCLILVLAIIVFISIYINRKFGKQNKEHYEGDRQIVLYYANWCGHSKNFLPTWEKFVGHCAKNIPDLKVVSILCEGENKEKCANVRGFPTVIYNNNNESTEFNGNRTVEDLVSFVNN